ncbi:MAG: hypothetical protein P8J32_00215 [bacterium]|nr:hypothetical protein [bacterium]
MGKSIKNFLLESMSEWDQEYNHLSEDTVGGVEYVTFDKGDDYIRIDFLTSFGTKASMVTSFEKFKEWFKSLDGVDKPPYKKFVKDFLRVSQEKDELEEVIDDDGNIMGDDDMPPNTTNTMIGTSNWDLDKVYQSSIPKSIRMYSGDMGIGIMTW